MSLKRVEFSDIITFTRASEKTVVKDGQLVTYGVDESAFDDDGLTVHQQSTRLNTIAAAPAVAEDVTVTAEPHTVSFYGTGTIDLTGAHVETIVGDGAFPTRTEVTFTPTAGTLTITPSGDVQHLQLEALGFATPPILGEGSQVTRPADDCSIDDLSKINFNPNEGTFVVEFVIDAIKNQQRVLNGSKIGSPKEDYRIIYNASVTGRFACYDGQNFTELFDSAQPNSRYIVALAIEPDKIRASTNGGDVVTGDHNGNFLDIDSLLIASPVALDGVIPKLKYYPRALTDAELQQEFTL